VAAGPWGYADKQAALERVEDLAHVTLDARLAGEQVHESADHKATSQGE
jgi:hypothetical protein